MMLITTSRKPGQLTRAVARTLADALGAAYWSRGKAGVSSVLSEADRMGADKVLFVWERHGNPSRLVGFDLEKAEKATQMEEVEQEIQEKQEKKVEKVAPLAKREKKDPKMSQNAPENEESEENDEQPEYAESGWLKPEIAIQGVVYHRKPIRHKGAKIKAEDAFGRSAAGLLDAKVGPNQIVLSQSGLKITVDSDFVLELKFRQSNT